MPDQRSFQTRVASHGDSIVLCFNAKDPTLEDELGAVVWNYCAYSWAFMEHRRDRFGSATRITYEPRSQPRPNRHHSLVSCTLTLHPPHPTPPHPTPPLTEHGSATADAAEMLDLRDLTWPEVPGSGGDTEGNLETASLDGMRGEGEADEGMEGLEMDLAGI